MRITLTMLSMSIVDLSSMSLLNVSTFAGGDRRGPLLIRWFPSARPSLHRILHFLRRFSRLLKGSKLCPTVRCRDKGTSVTIRYDTRCYLNVRSKADISQLSLPHGTNN